MEVAENRQLGLALLTADHDMQHAEDNVGSTPFGRSRYGFGLRAVSFTAWTESLSNLS
jgi:hypothetical protein